MKLFKLFSILLLLPVTFLFAQDESNSDVEEVVVVGSQIKGAKILIMGLTFKENCSDIRNSGVQNVIAKFFEMALQLFMVLMLLLEL